MFYVVLHVLTIYCGVLGRRSMGQHTLEKIIIKNEIRGCTLISYIETRGRGDLESLPLVELDSRP